VSAITPAGGHCRGCRSGEGILASSIKYPS
jgi:hypothetical protein